MIVEHESCLWCGARLLEKYETCPHCNGPLGKTEIEYVQRYKDVDTLYTWGGLSNDLYYMVKYKDGTKKKTKFDRWDLFDKFRYAGGIFEIERYIIRELCIRFDLDPMQLEQFKRINLNGYCDYPLTQ